jgi:hypothetical protein
MADLFMGASSPHSSLPDDTAERARAREEAMLPPTMDGITNADMSIPLSHGFNADMSIPLSHGFNAGMSMPFSHGFNAGMSMPLSHGFNAGMSIPLSHGFNAGVSIPLSHGFNTERVNTERVNTEQVNVERVNTEHANIEHVSTQRANTEHVNTKRVNTERGPAKPAPKKRKTGGGRGTPAPVVKYDKTVLYPPGLKRVLKLDKNTFGINTAPLADDTPWSRIGVPAIREQLDIRCVASDGTKSEIINRIKNWRKYVGLEKEVYVNYRAAFQIETEEWLFARSNAANRATKWLHLPSDGVSGFFTHLYEHSSADISSQTWENYLEVNGEDFRMCVIKREDLPWTDGLPNVDKESATFTIGTFCINTYTVMIGAQCYCTCPTKVKTSLYLFSFLLFQY